MNVMIDYRAARWK